MGTRKNLGALSPHTGSTVTRLRELREAAALRKSSSLPIRSGRLWQPLSAPRSLQPAPHPPICAVPLAINAVVLLRRRLAQADQRETGTPTSHPSLTVPISSASPFPCISTATKTPQHRAWLALGDAVVSRPLSLDSPSYLAHATPRKAAKVMAMWPPRSSGPTPAASATPSAVSAPASMGRGPDTGCEHRPNPVSSTALL